VGIEPLTLPSRSAVVWPALVAATAAAAHVAVARRVDRLVATVGEARLAAATFAARGAEVGEVALPAADGFAVRQLAVVETLLPTGGLPVVDAARVAALALGFVSAVLLWPVLRHLGAGPVPSAVATGLVGVVPPIVRLHAGITAAAPATLWLVLAAALAALSRRRAVLAAVAAALAALTAPLAAAALLALAAHLVHVRTVATWMPRALRVSVAALLGFAAAGTAVASAGNGPLAGVGGPVVGLGTTLVVVVAGLTIAGLAWTQLPELRPALTPVLLLLAVAVVPGAARSAALLLVLPFLAAVVAVLAEPLAALVPAARRPAAAAVPLTALSLALVVGLLGVVNARPVHPASLAGWVSSDLGPDAVLRADPLDRAELLAGGVPAERLRDLAGPAAPSELLMVTDRPANGSVGDVPQCLAITTLATIARGAGGAPTAVCPAAPIEPANVVAEQARRARFGTALASNAALDLDPAAAAALRAGLVDPRVVLILAGLASPRRLTVADFPVAPFEPPYALRRRVLLTAVDGLPASGDPLPLVRTWLTAQQSPFAPTSIEPEGPALLIGYPAPTPTGLLG
jgi:hypothetical protein